MDALDVAYSAKLLGAGRDKKSDSIDYGAGVILNKKVGDYVNKGDVVMELYYNDVNDEKIATSIKSAREAFEIADNKIEELKLIYKGI